VCEGVSMAKIKLISDIHIDYEADHGLAFIDSLPSDDTDILVLAGDVVTDGHLGNYYDTFKALCDKFDQVLYVLGNHDHYQHTIEETFTVASNFQATLSNFHWLQNERRNIKGVNFVGATLWFPKCTVYSGWPDFRYVKSSPEDIFAENEKTKKFLLENVHEGDFVVTHHLPSAKCIAAQWQGSRSNCYFNGDVDNIILEKKPRYWAFGHTHESRHMIIGDTELFCNPRAYPHEQHSCGFRSDLIIDTELEKKYT